LNICWIIFISSVACQVCNVVLAYSHHITNHTQENVSKSLTSILYQKKYKMPHLIFAVILLPLLAHAQEINPAMLRDTWYSCDYKPLLTVELAEPAAQGMILIITALAVITFFLMYTLQQKKGFVKAYSNKKKNVNGMLQHTTGGLAQAGQWLARKFVQIWKFFARPNVSGSPACAKPLGRYKQWRIVSYSKSLE